MIALVLPREGKQRIKMISSTLFSNNLAGESNGGDARETKEVKMLGQQGGVGYLSAKAWKAAEGGGGIGWCGESDGKSGEEKVEGRRRSLWRGQGRGRKAKEKETTRPF